MYYYQKNKKGSGIFDSIINAVSSNIVKDVATKALTEVGNRGSQKVIDKVFSPKPKKEDNEEDHYKNMIKNYPLKSRKGKGLTEESINILNKHLGSIPSVKNPVKIQDYVKSIY